MNVKLYLRKYNETLILMKHQTKWTVNETISQF